MSNEELGTLIQKYRKAHKLSQTDFAEMFNVSQPTIGSWELGKFGPSGIKRDQVVQLVSGKKEEVKNEIEHLQEIIYHQKIIIELQKDKIRDLGGSL